MHNLQWHMHNLQSHNLAAAASCICAQPCSLQGLHLEQQPAAAQPAAAAPKAAPKAAAKAAKK